MRGFPLQNSEIIENVIQLCNDILYLRLIIQFVIVLKIRDMN